MIQKTVEVASASGLHARPAAIFVKAATNAGGGVQLVVEGKKPATAASMLAVLALGVECGDTVTLQTEDTSEAGQAAIDELAALLQTDLDADPEQ